MNKIGIISDIHGNIPALDAVLKDIEERRVDRIICLGDIIGKGPHPHVAIDRIKEKCDIVIMGNWDHMATIENEFPMVKWAKEKIGKKRIDYLKELPFSVDFLMSGKLVRLFHASPQGIYHRVHQNSSREKIEGMFENTEYTGKGLVDDSPHIVGYGDIHGAYVNYFDNKTLFNVGSVGNPLDMPMASYAVIEGMYGSEEAKSFSINIIRVAYDIDLAVKQAIQSDMPELEEYINELITGRYRGRK